MFVQKKFEKVKTLERKGILSKIALPKDVKTDTKTYMLRAKPRTMELVKGNGSFAITDEVGFCEGVEFSLIFTNECMLIEVLKGKIYVREDDSVFTLDKAGKLAKFKGSVEKIIWKSLSEMYDYTLHFVGVKYNLENYTIRKEYVNNLMFELFSSFVYSDCKLFTIRPLKYHESIGGKFKFEVKEKIEIKESYPVEYESNSIKEDEMEEDKLSVTMKGFIGKSKKNLYDLENENYDRDDDVVELEDEISIDLHEIDIFKDYNSESY